MTIRSLCFLLAAVATCGLLICTCADVLCAQESTAETEETASEADLNCLPGDPTPPLAIREWVQRGVYEEVAPADGRLITVIEFWASWCPLCRAVLPLQDDLQARLKRKGVRFLAISPEEPEDVRAYLEHAGLEHLAIACDDGEKTLNSFRTLDQNMPIPFAVITGQDESTGAARVLWKGPVVTYEDCDAWSAGYTLPFEEVLASVLAGRFDVEAAREIEACRDELARLKEQIDLSWGQPRQIGPLAEQIIGREWPAECSDLAVSALATAAWFLATAEEHTEDEAALALELARAAMEANEEEHHALLHILARALYENGKTAEAIAAERKAVESYEDDASFAKADYLEALARYEQALAAQEGEAAAAPAEEPEDQAPPEKAKQKLTVVADLVSAEQAKEDLLSLHEQLHLVYAGYDDAAWELSCAGSSWDEHNSAFLRRIEERTEWPLSDFIDLLLDYLRITKDQHLFIQAVHSQSEWHDHRPVSGCLPFFSDVRVREEGGRKVLVEVPAKLSHLQGAEIPDIAVIPTPRTAELGRAYLFPTLPRDPQQSDTKEYLLGLLADEAQDPPESVTVSVLTLGGSSGGPEDVALPLHRGRVVFRGERDPAWSVDLEPLPVVSVRRMSGEGLEGIPGTAAQVRDRPVVLLDLRGNGGGNTQWAIDWCTRFTDQPLRVYVGVAGLRRGETDPLRRWDSIIWGHLQPPAAGRDECSGEGAFRGRLFVLIDEGVGSSGEEFAGLVSQIPGAVLLGEKTGGCLSYGNLAVVSLPNSRLCVVGGPTKFVPAGRPSRERFGYFPDYWLDTEDPVAAIAAYCGAEPSG